MSGPCEIGIGRRGADGASQLFRSEFIYPIEGLAVNLLKTLTGLETDSVIQLTRGEGDAIAFVELTDLERTRGRENFDFYCFMIWPYVEASWLAAVSLMALTPRLGSPPDASVQLKDAQGMAQLVRRFLLCHASGPWD